MATKERILHNELFRVLIDYCETHELDRCKSPFLPDFIQRNIIEMNLSAIDDEPSEGEEDGEPEADAARMDQLEARL